MATRTDTSKNRYLQRYTGIQGASSSPSPHWEGTVSQGVSMTVEPLEQQESWFTGSSVVRSAKSIHSVVSELVG